MIIHEGVVLTLYKEEGLEELTDMLFEWWAIEGAKMEIIGGSRRTWVVLSKVLYDKYEQQILQLQKKLKD